MENHFKTFKQHLLDMSSLSTFEEAIAMLPDATRCKMCEIVGNSIADMEVHPNDEEIHVSPYIKCLSLLNDASNAINVDPLQIATAYYIDTPPIDFEWFTSPDICKSDFDSLSNGVSCATLYYSPYKEDFFKRIGATAEDCEAINRFLKAIASGDFADFPTKLPKTFIAPEAGKLFRIYTEAATIENQRLSESNVCEHQLKLFEKLTNSAYSKLQAEYPDDIKRWGYYWNNNFHELVNIYQNIIDLAVLPADDTEIFSKQDAEELTLLAVLFHGLIINNWEKYLFEDQISQIFRGTNQKIMLSKFVERHQYGNEFKYYYRNYCDEHGLRPIFYIENDLLEDYAGQDEKQCIIPSYNGHASRKFNDRCREIDALFEKLKDWGAFGEEISPNLRLLFRYRLAGCKPIPSQDDKIPWRKSKTELAVLCKLLLNDNDDRPPFKRLASFFKGQTFIGEDINITQLAKSAKRETEQTIENIIKSSLKITCSKQV